MNSANDIERALVSTRFTIPPEIDERILSDAIRALARRQRSWMPMMRRAAIVLLSVGVIASVTMYFQRPSLTLAQVTQAYAKQTWVHIKYDNGREEWTNLSDGRYFFRDYDGRVVYTEPDGLRLSWSPEYSASFISKDKWFVGNAPPESRQNAVPWEEFVKPYEHAAREKKTKSGSSSVQQVNDVLDGKKVIRFDCYMTDALGRRLLILQIWADPQSRLPVQRRQVLQLGEREAQKRDAITGRYDFPKTGPASINDLGVPHNLPVLDDEAKPGADVEKILAAGQAARDRWPTCYRILIWPPDDQSGAVSRIYHDDKRFARTRWFTSSMGGVPEFPKNATLGQVEAWLGTRLPVEQEVDDGHRDFFRRNNIYHQSDMPPIAETRVQPETRWAGRPADDPNYPPGIFWPYLNRSGAPVEFDLPPDTPKGLLALRWEYGDGRSEFWIDPTKDFICVRNAKQKRVNGHWTDERVEVLSDFERLPTGQWYAATRKVEQHPSQTGVSDSQFEESIAIKVLKRSDLPPGTFDGEKLIKGAKVETY